VLEGHVTKAVDALKELLVGQASLAAEREDRERHEDASILARSTAEPDSCARD